MRRRALIPAALALVLSGAIPPPERSNAAEAADHPPPVVIELFTSQGCSSCPPADRLLARLAAAGRLDGVEIIPLAFHVDYWNHIGWEDPFSSERWSDRQRAYATALGLSTIYTPQLFLNGRRQMVGADERELRREIRELTRRPPTVRLSLAVAPPATAAGEVRVHASAESLSGEPQRHSVVMLAVFQDGLVTPVSRGENARRTLANERVVRGLHALFEIGPVAGAAGEKIVDLELDPTWPHDDLGLALFAQDPESLAIRGATAIRLAETSD